MIIWQPDQQINKGRFIIQGTPLGSGGFGITYKAKEPSTGKLFAIKTLNQTLQIQEDFAEQQVKFINEALTIRTFEHPHVVKVYEVIQEDGLWGMVMEYIDGLDLNKYLQKNGQLSENEALLYIDQIGQALEYIHQKQHLHRDIKPQNIILRRDKKEAVLVDFGLARNIATKSMTNSRTEGYAPIEQYRRKGNFGSHTDVYALAATLYYILTADALKKADEEIVSALNRKYENEPLPEPKYYNPSISQRVNDAIIQGMIIEPEERTSTVLKFRESLGLVVKPVVNIPIPLPVDYTPVPVKERPKQNIPTPQKVQEIFAPKNSTPPQPVKQEVQLKSAVEMNYTRLRDLLAAEKWKKADEETARVMLAVAKWEEEDWLEAKWEEEGWLDVKDIDNFPCEDLRTIDQLWVKYSNGQFGFSVQKRVYQSLGGTREYNSQIWQAYGDKVGWRKRGDWLYYKDITFDKTAPVAHLPVKQHLAPLGGVGFLGLGVVWEFSLLSRRDL